MGPSTIVKPVTILPNIIELAYYSNCVLPAYAMEAVIGQLISNETVWRLLKIVVSY